MQQIQQTTAPVQNSFWAGFHDGVPIGLGYLSVSVTFGMMAVTGGLPVWAVVLLVVLLSPVWMPLLGAAVGLGIA